MQAFGAARRPRASGHAAGTVAPAEPARLHGGSGPQAPFRGAGLAFFQRAGPYALEEGQSRATERGLWAGTAVEPRLFRRRHGPCGVP